MLRIDGYSTTKGLLGVNKGISSCTFCVGGHSWYIKYYPDGYDKESSDWISVFLRLNYPARVDHDVRARFKFSVLDQNGEPVTFFTLSSQMHTFSKTCESWGYDKFAKRKDLESSSHVKNDTIHIRCDVTVMKIQTHIVVSSESLVKVPPSNLHQHLGDLLVSQVGSDVAFEVGDEVFLAHRTVLAARSSVFKVELLGPMKETSSPLVQVKDMEASTFKALLHFIYTDSLPDIDEANKITMAQHLLVAADRYAMERLKLICEDILCNFIDTSTAATTIVLAEQHGCYRLKEACFKFLKNYKNLHEVMETDGFDHLIESCPSLLKELLRRFTV